MMPTRRRARGSPVGGGVRPRAALPLSACRDASRLVAAADGEHVIYGAGRCRGRAWTVSGRGRGGRRRGVAGLTLPSVTNGGAHENDDSMLLALRVSDSERTLLPARTTHAHPHAPALPPGSRSIATSANQPDALVLRFGVHRTFWHRPERITCTTPCSMRALTRHRPVPRGRDWHEDTANCIHLRLR